MHLKTSFNVENVIFYWTSSGCLRFLACHNNTMAAAALHWRGDWLGTWHIFFPRFPLSCLQMHTSSQRRVLSRLPRLVAACTHYRAPSWPPAVSGPVFSSWPDPLPPPLSTVWCLGSQQTSRGWWLLLLWLLLHNDHGPQVSTSNWAFSCKIWWK